MDVDDFSRYALATAPRQGRQNAKKQRKDKHHIFCVCLLNFLIVQVQKAVFFMVAPGVQKNTKHPPNMLPTSTLKQGPEASRWPKKSVQNRCTFFLRNPASMLVHFSLKMGATMKPKICQKTMSQPAGPPRASRKSFWSHFGSILDPPRPHN